jgi:hypothetical protein
VDAPDYAALPRLTISLEIADTPDRYCSEYAGWLFPIYTRNMGAQVPGFSHYGTGTSVAILPDTYDEWFESVGQSTRRKIRRAEKLGYTFEQIDRDKYLDDIYEINNSLEERQGRQMDAAYRERWKEFGPLPEQPCPRHRLLTYGVLKDGKLYAYTWVYQTGEMLLPSTLLGHGAYMNDGIMFLLLAGVFRDLIETAGTRYAVYERHWSGLPGLRFFKEQLGFRPHMVTFLRGDEKPPTRREKIAAAFAPHVEAVRKQRTRATRGVKRRVKPVRAYLGRVKRGVKRRIAERRGPSD